MFERLYRWTLGLAGHPRAEWALGIISFVESSFFPIPADVLFVPMGLARPERIWRYALIASVTSVLGGLFGWCIGHYAFDLIARPFLEATGKMASFEALRDGAGTWAILVMLVTSGLAHVPPMKVVTILAGVLSGSSGMEAPENQYFHEFGRIPPDWAFASLGLVRLNPAGITQAQEYLHQGHSYLDPGRDDNACESHRHP
jgi:membrane protein YqaA with SNARE-associated domain